MRQAVIESGRAEFALNAVKSIINNENDKTKKEYKSYARKFPTMVLSNGLAASIAFIVDKGGSHSLIYNNISEWLVKNGTITESESLEKYVCSLNSDDYRVVTSEVLSLFLWIKRFASGLIEGEE